MLETAELTRVTRQLNDLGEARERDDSDAVYELLDHLRQLTSTNGKAVQIRDRAAREAIDHIWQLPRMPGNNLGRGRRLVKRSTLIFSHNKPLIYPWSPKARDAFFAFVADPSQGLTNTLDTDHITPIGTLAADLMSELEGGMTRDEFFVRIHEVHEPFCFAILTQKEHRGMSGDHKSGRIGDGVSLFVRYQEALGLDESDLISVLEDPRWEEARRAGLV